jgi:hypothetical protein
VSVEADAHNEEDPMAIAVRVMKACCDFYDADWCGILIADLQTQAFIPEIWYEPEIGPMQDTLFNDIEFTEEFATWAKHLIEQKPLIIPDAEKIREDLLVEEANRAGMKQRMDELEAFLAEQTTEVTEYDEGLVRQLIEKITVYDDHLAFEFKSGLETEVQM